jgi:ribosomal protein S27AE
MRFVNRAAKVAKYVTVTMPLSIFGWQLNKGLFAWNRSMWTRTVNPTCPDCDAGVLLAQRQTEGGDARPLQAWACNRCGFDGTRDAANRHRLARAQIAFGELSLAEREAFGRQHRIASRIFFAAAAVIGAHGIYLLASAAPFIIALNWMSFGMMFWVFGMKKSYRSWQVTTGHIFQDGAARHWFGHEKWLV